MSESLFLSKSNNRFLAEHPCDEGWMVCEFANDTALKLYLHCVVDCLRDRHPDALKRRAAVSLVEEDVVRKQLDLRGTSHAGAGGGFSGELDSFGWRGEVEFVWNGYDIHCCMLTLVLSRGCADVYLVATKSLAAFQDFLLALDRYGQARYKGEKKEILVVNGDNIPLPASSWDDVVLPAGMARAIRTNVQAFFDNPARYGELGIPHRRGFCSPDRPVAGKRSRSRRWRTTRAPKFITILGKADVVDDAGRPCAASGRAIHARSRPSGGS